METPPDIMEEDVELNAMRTVYGALKGLDSAAQNRVLDYVMRRLGMQRGSSDHAVEHFSERVRGTEKIREQEPNTDAEAEEGLEGISPVAQKWMKRNALTASELSSLYSLGVDDIDLVASTVPGKGTKEKMRNVLLLKGIAAYIGSGAARISDDKLREACGHYGAYDSTNFSKQIISLGAEVTGNKESGYTLTSRGVTEATKLIKQLTAKIQ